MPKDFFANQTAGERVPNSGTRIAYDKLALSFAKLGNKSRCTLRPPNRQFDVPNGQFVAVWRASFTLAECWKVTTGVSWDGLEKKDFRE